MHAKGTLFLSCVAVLVSFKVLRCDERRTIVYPDRLGTNKYASRKSPKSKRYVLCCRSASAGWTSSRGRSWQRRRRPVRMRSAENAPSLLCNRCHAAFEIEHLPRRARETHQKSLKTVCFLACRLLKRLEKDSKKAERDAEKARQRCG